MDTVGILLKATADTQQAQTAIESLTKAKNDFISADANFSPFITRDRQRNDIGQVSENRGQEFDSFIQEDKTGDYLSSIKEAVGSIINELKEINRSVKNIGNPNNLSSDGNSAVDNGGNDSNKDVLDNKKIQTLQKAITGGAGAMAFNKLVDTGFSAWDGMNGVLDSERKSRISALQGDAWGARQSDINRNVNIEKTVTSGMLMPAAIGIGALVGGPVGALLGAAVGGGIKKIADGVTQRVAAEEQSKIEFKSAMSSMYKEGLATNERGVSEFFDRSEGLKDNDAGLAFGRRKAVEFGNVLKRGAEDTGLGLDEFAEYMHDFARQGIGFMDPRKAANMVNRAASWAGYTGGDTGQFVTYLGKVARYGDEGQDSLNRAYGAARASGLENAQFGEFLSGLESVIESGISKGFIKSTDEVSSTMVMLSQLSGNSEFWKGEQGAQRLNQINSGIAGATALDSTTQMLTYRAFRNSGLATKENIGEGTFISGEPVLNAFALMEQGLNPKSFRNISRTFQNAFGGDVMSNVMAWKELSGLNYTGAMQLYNMQGQGFSDSEIQKKINDLQKDPNFQSDSGNLKNVVNELQNMGRTLGIDAFREEVGSLNDYAAKIYEEVSSGGGSGAPAEEKKTRKGLFGLFGGREQSKDGGRDPVSLLEDIGRSLDSIDSQLQNGAIEIQSRETT